MNPLPLEHPLVVRLGWTLLHFVWQGAVLGIVAGIVLWLVRRRSPETRYNIALALFTLLAVAPFATFCAVDGMSTRTAETLVGIPTLAEFDSKSRRPDADTTPLIAAPADSDSNGDQGTSPHPAVETDDASPLPNPAFDAASFPPAMPQPAPSPRASFVSTIIPVALPWVVAAWVCGVVVLSLRLCGGWWWTRRCVARHAQPVAAGWRCAVDRLRLRLHVHRAVRCVESATASVPVVVGWLRPVVIVPGSILSGLAPQEVECLLAHELAHVRRNDYLVNLAQCVVEVLLFYHPVVWWLSRRVRHERECVCDELAVAATGDRLAYTRALLCAAEIAVRTPGLAVAATQGDLSQRVHAILGRAAPSGRASGWVVLMLTALLLSAAVSVRPPEVPGSQDTLAQGDTSESAEAKVPTEGVDLYGDPLPEGALVRLGTVRYRQAGGHATVVFLPDGNTALVGPGLLRLVDLPTGRTIGRLPFDRHPVHLMAGTPDGSRVVLIGSEFVEAQLDHVYSATVWDVQNASELGHVEWQKRDGGAPACACLSADGTVLAIGDATGLVRVIDAEAGLEAKTQRFTVHEISRVAISADGSRVAVATQHDGVWLWEWPGEKPPAQLRGFVERPSDVQFSPDGRLLAGCKDSYGALLLWDPVDGRLIRQMTMAERGLTTRRLAFRPNSSEIAAICYSTAQVHFWDVNSGKFVRTIQTDSRSPDTVDISPDGRWLVATGSEREISVWDLAAGKQMGREYQGHGDPPQSILFTPDGDGVVTAASDNLVGVWDARRGSLLQQLRHADQVFAWAGGIAVSPDGRLIASSAHDDTVGIWERETGRRLFTLAGHGSVGGREVVQFTPDGQRLLSWGSDLFLRVFDVRTGKVLIENPILPEELHLQVDEETGGVRGDAEDLFLGRASFSQDGKSLVLTVGVNVQVYDVESGRKSRTYPLRAPNYSSAYSPDHELVATVVRAPSERTPLVSGGQHVSASQKQFVHLLRTGDGEIVRELPLADGFARCQVFSADAKLLAVAVSGADRRTQIFNVDDGQLTSEIVIDTPAIHAVAFSPDARYLATSLDDTSVVLWEIARFAVAAQ